MSTPRNHCASLLASISVILTGLPGSSVAQEAGYGVAPDVLSFRATVESTAPFLESISGHDAQHLRLMGGLVQWDYTLRRKFSEIDLSFDRASILFIVDGMENENREMSKEGMRQRVEGQWSEVTNAKLRRELQDSFGTPLCRITVDKDGRETSRLYNAKPGAAPLLRAGVIENARLFHAPFYSDRVTWEAPLVITMGPSGFARGQMRYEVVPGDSGAPRHFVHVNVSGLATKKRDAGSSRLEVEYKISGEQTYSIPLREWVNATWRVELFYDQFNATEKIETDIAAMTLTMALLGSKTAGP